MRLLKNKNLDSDINHPELSKSDKYFGVRRQSQH